MAANVETMFSVRETPWHGLGEIIQDAPTSEDAIRLAGLDWEVVQYNLTAPVIMTDKNGNATRELPVKGNFRNTDNKFLGVVTDKYKVVQNRDAFAFTDALVGEGVTYETAGSLASGKRVWMLARMEDRNISDELMSPYLVFTNSHDGTGAVKVAITPVRVVCQNTLNLALRQAERHWSCNHMGDIQGKMEDARMTLLNTEKYLKTLETEFGDLKLKRLTVDQVNDLVDYLIPIDELELLEKPNDKKIVRLMEKRKELMDRYLYAPDLEQVEHSAYRFINAVSDFATHTEPLRQTKNGKENRFMKTVDGNNIIDLAYKLIDETRVAV